MRQCPICNSAESRKRYEFEWGEVRQCKRCTGAFVEGCDIELKNELAFAGEAVDESLSLNRQWANERLSSLTRFLGKGRLLEMGPGTGEFLHAAASTGFTAVGIDRYPRMRAENQHERVTMIASDARTFDTALPFDAVAALHVLEHFSDPHELLGVIKRLLRAGGYLLIEVPNYGSLSRMFAGRKWNCFVNYHALQFTPRSLRLLLEQMGFETVSLETVGCSTTQLIGLGVPSIGRRLGLPVRYGWEPNGNLRRFASNIESRFNWGYNLRVVARKR